MKIQRESLVTPCRKDPGGVWGWGGTAGAFPVCMYL